MIRALIFLLLIVTSVASAAQKDAKSVFEKAISQMLTNNLQMLIHQKTTDKKGRTKEKSFEVLMAKMGEEEKTKMIMQKPDRAAGVTIVFTKSPGNDGVIEVYTPANGKTRKMLATPKNMAMIGSDFSISNYGNVDSKTLSFKMLEELEWNKQSCYKIEISGNSENNNGKAELIIEQGSFKIVQIDTYNEKGSKSSISKLSNYHEIEGLKNKFQPLLIVTENLEKKELSEMEVLKIIPNNNLKDEDFLLGSN